MWQKRVILPTLGFVSWKLKAVGSRGVHHSIDLVNIYWHAHFYRTRQYYCIFNGGHLEKLPPS